VADPPNVEDPTQNLWLTSPGIERVVCIKAASVLYWSPTARGLLEMITAD
jgi:hypothetical protein